MQSVNEKMPPHNAKLPPIMGPRLAINFSPPMNFPLLGARHAPTFITSVTFAKVPDDTTHTTHRECTSEVVDDAIRTRLFARSHNYFISW